MKFTSLKMVCFTLSFLMSYFVLAAPSDDEIEKLAHSKEWRRLMHYQPHWYIGPERSLVDGEEFFLSPKGATDLVAEMKATLKAFDENRQVGRLKQNPQCAFPMRLEFLKEKLHINPAPVKCEKLDEFLAKFNGDSTVLVFSSALPNNPGSMFGHTFFRINSKSKGMQDLSKMDLLDNGISYAANVPPDDGGMLFYFFGLTGGYPGAFSLLPYYQKVNEYVQSESRDLWEYELSLTQAETTKLLKHIWEIETNSYFYYWFFDENCAYQLMSVIEAIKPEWSLTDQSPYVTPIGTVQKMLDIPGAVRKIEWRPSLRYLLTERLNKLNSTQRDQFLKVTQRKLSAKEVQDPAVLDASAAYVLYQKQKHEQKMTPEEKALQKEILIQRSHLGQATEVPAIVRQDYPIEKRPDLGHSTYRLGLNYGRASQYTFEQLHFKFAYHDMLNFDQGFIPFSEFNFPNFTFRYLNSSHRYYLEQLEFFRVISLMPLSFFEKTGSWLVSMDDSVRHDLNCEDCRTFKLQTGYGVTLPIQADRTLFTAMAIPQLEAGAALHRGYRITPKFETALMDSSISRLKVRAAYTLQTDVIQSDRQKVVHIFDEALSYAVLRNIEIRLTAIQHVNTSERRTSYRESLFALNFYF